MTGHRRLEGDVYPGGRSRPGDAASARAEVTIGTDVRSWLLARVRFSDLRDPELRQQLEEVKRHRGAIARRLARSMEELWIVGWDAYECRKWRLVGRLEEAVAHDESRSLPETDFGLWVTSASGPGLGTGRVDGHTDGRVRPGVMPAGGRG